LANPYAQDSAFWESALEHYHWDRLDDAYGQIVQQGVGEAGSFLRWYRIIEAETVTRRKSEQVEVTPWLTFEYVPEEIRELRSELVRAAVSACDEVAHRLGWEHGEKTLLSILAEETDAPWAVNPYGYCVTKEPYEKICLPNYLVDDLEEFAQAVAHEYGHVITNAYADGYAPRWLEEAVSVLVERRFDEQTRLRFASGEIPWRLPGDLEVVFEATGREEAEEDRDDDVWLAYQQAGWIGRYLVSLGDELRLGRLLRETANESVLRNLRLALTGRERVDGALQAVYSFDSATLFRRSLHWLCQTKLP